MTISSKWPAARLKGPKVSVENALEYIRRTDVSLIRGGWCNSKRFTAAFEAKYFDYPPPGFVEAFGGLSLEHLYSSFIASPSIQGPYGPVHPDGTVHLAKNFGKWPSVDEVEGDLKAVSEAFPWLEFSLCLWDDVREGKAVNVSDPSHGWKLGSGTWERAEDPKALWLSMGEVEESDFDANLFSAVFASPERRETTWTVGKIDEMWGDRIRKALSECTGSLQSL